MRRARLTASVLALAVLSIGGTAAGQTADLVDRRVLRVCADPANMPFSNDRQEGFENKVAELLGDKLGVPVAYTWFPQATGFIRQTLGAKRCDLVMGYAQGHELVQGTNHYYKTAYVLVYPEGSDLAGVTSLDDERLQGKRLGVVAGSPPATILAMKGLIGLAKPYPLMVDRRFMNPAADMLNDIASGDIVAGILWGPIGGYFAREADTPMTVVPLTNETIGPRQVYRITMGVRHNENEWKRRLNRLIRRHQDEIDAILAAYGVPILDRNDEPIEVAEVADISGVEEPLGYRMEDYRARVPPTLKGGTVISTQDAVQFYADKKAAFIDVLPHQDRPESLPDSVKTVEKDRRNIPGTEWLPNVGYGAIPKELDAYFRDELERISGGDKAAPLVFYCLADCWMSWNAAKRAIEMGYSDVHWYPDGTDGWAAANLPLAVSRPVPGYDAEPQN